MALAQAEDGGDHEVNSFCNEDFIDTSENAELQGQNEQILQSDSFQEAPQVEMIKHKVLPIVEQASSRDTSDTRRQLREEGHQYRLSNISFQCKWLVCVANSE